MKKLMFAAVAGLAVTGFCVESEIVGYSNNGLLNGGKVLIGQFLACSGENVPLDSFVPTGDELDDQVGIQTLNSFGYTDSANSYMWMDWGGDDVGWAQDYTLVSGVTLKPGQGFWATGRNSEMGLQSSGKVGTEDVVYTLCNGGVTTGNPFPVPVELQDILAEGDDLDDQVGIQTLNSFGYTDSANSYMWMDWGGDDIGWAQDYSLIPKGKVTIQPGQGFWATGRIDYDPKNPESKKQQVRFPAPEGL